MTTYIARRLIQTIIVIGLLSYICYWLMTMMPGDPVDLLISANPKITSEDIARLREMYDLDKPTYVRYFNWIKTIGSGDLGYSRTYRVPVSELLGPRLLNTFWLSSISLLLAIVVSVPLGVFAALRPGKRVDYVINFFAFAGISIPSFWLSIVLIIVFSVWIPLFPAGGTYTPGLEDVGFWAGLVDRAKYLVLPVATLTLLSIGTFVRFTRSSMMEALRNDYIRTAKAKGLSRRVVIYQHGFRNALIPVITIIALSFSSLFSGALITETVFAYQGIGKLVYDSIVANDFNVAMIAFMISISMVLIFSLIADILYGVADPRISYH